MSHVRYRVQGGCPPHTHGRAFIAMVLSGGYAEHFRTFSLTLGATQLSFHPEGTQHADEVSTPGTSFLIVEAARPFVDLCADTCRQPQLLGPEAAGRGAELVAALHDGDVRTPLAIDSLATELFGEVPVGRRARGEPTPRWVDRVLELLRADHARPLTLRELAQAVDLHPVYLSRAFRQFTGRGLMHTLRSIRVERALLRLAGGTPIVDVALASGFADQSHLTKSVRRVTGRTPGQWRSLQGRAADPRGALPRARART